MPGASFTTPDGHYELMPAEVLNVIYSDANPNLVYGIQVKILDGNAGSDNPQLSSITAKPLNANFLRIPIVGEIVLLLKAPSSYSAGLRNNAPIYYLDIVSLQSSVHHNALPTAFKISYSPGDAAGNSNSYNEASAGSTQKSSSPKIDSNFSENSSVKPLQHYIGDVLILGRYGNSLRFSTTPKSGTFTKNPNWSGGSAAAPISILRTARQQTRSTRINEFSTEDFINDDNVFIQATGQNLNFEQSSKILKSADSKNITSWKTENWGTTPQTLISSGRIIFNSTQREIIAFAKNGIALSSETSATIDAKENVSINSNKIELGTDADEPVMLGNKWKDWAESLIDDLGRLVVVTPAGPSSPLASSPQWPTIIAYKSKINALLSDQTFVKKSS